MKETDTPINITAKCNLKCIFCARPGGNFEDSKEEIIKIIKRDLQDIKAAGIHAPKGKDHGIKDDHGQQ